MRIRRGGCAYSVRTRVLRKRPLTAREVCKLQRRIARIGQQGTMRVSRKYACIMERGGSRAAACALKYAGWADHAGSWHAGIVLNSAQELGTEFTLRLVADGWCCRMENLQRAKGPGFYASPCHDCVLCSPAQVRPTRPTRTSPGPSRSSLRARMFSCVHAYSHAYTHVPMRSS